jgi:hypothetical protein
VLWLCVGGVCRHGIPCCLLPVLLPLHAVSVPLLLRLVSPCLPASQCTSESIHNHKYP